MQESLFARQNCCCIPNVPAPLYARSCGISCVTENSPRLSPAGKNEFVEIFWCLSGTGTIRLYGEDFRLHKGEVFSYLPNEEHLLATENEITCAWIVFDGPLAETVFRSYKIPRRKIVFQKFPNELFQQLSTLLPLSDSKAVLKSSLIILEFLTIIATEAENRTEPGKSIRNLYYQLIRRHFSNPDFNVDALSEMLGLHPVSLCRIVRQNSNRTPKQLISNVRLTHARMLLIGTDLLIQEIAGQSGFSDEGSFCRFFKSKTGMSPTQYRNREKKESVKEKFSGSMENNQEA